MRRRMLGLLSLALLAAMPAWGQQQTGSVSGKVTSPDNQPMPGVMVEASGDVLPQARTTTTDSDGMYRFPVLPPGNYELSFELEGMATETRQVKVLLTANAQVNVTMAPQAVEESIEVIGQAGLIDHTSAELKTAIDNETIQALPVGQSYRDLQKLIPGVQYSESQIRGPSGGGSGQDNVYLYDGVNVSLPLFGVLSAEPSSHDIDQVAVVKGGAKAVDFNRSAGFTINSLSKSGTNKFRGEVSYQIQSAGMTSDVKHDQTETFDEDKDWTVASLGGPILKDRLFFYASYFRPTRSRDNAANAYGPVPGFDSTRDEYFGRLSFAPTDNILIHGSYRDSDRDDKNASIGAFEAPSTASVESSKLKIAIVEGSWSTTSDQYLTFKYTDFSNDGATQPANRFGIPVAVDGSVALDVNNLDQMGYFHVPSAPTTPLDAALIQKYGYVDSGGAKAGGGYVGGYFQIDQGDYSRNDYQLGYNWFFGQNVTHNLHLGYQTYEDSEDLRRLSNAWGSIDAVPSTFGPNDTPYVFHAALYAQGIASSTGGVVPPIHSELQSQNVEVNDTIQWENWSFNVGFLVSQDKLYGQGLRENSSTPSGYELCESCKYKMYQVDFQDQIQPRLGAVWAYNGTDTVFVNYAQYNPAATSLPRAASWARNLTGKFIDVYFDANGNVLGSEQRGSSSGKFFQEDLKPRMTEEYELGTARRLSSHWTARVHGRFRHSFRFWEDTNNNARQFGNAPDDIPHELYIEDLQTKRDDVGGSSYVIARLNNAFTKYYEVGGEAEWRGDKAFFRGSYVWSHYYGNFDQDNTNGDPIDNDYSTFIGSSNLADGPGRQIWDMKYGDLHGDRRHLLKLYGYYTLDWNATVGAFALYQSGQPWETWDYSVYSAYTGSTSNTIRFAEPAGSHRSDSHYQLDLNYTQRFALPHDINLELRGDIFNVFDKQTGYAIQPNIHSAGYGTPTEYFDPRRLQLQVRISF